ncbi:MAG: sodium/proline symporter [Gemmatimonadetes bacterium]|nr:sodium/proline symporter [Gemmatimonadota bacterium]
MSTTWVIAVFSVYFSLLIVIAVVGARRMRNMSEYVLGGRRLSSFTAALSAGSSTTSAWTMLALPALAYVSGLVEMWIPLAAAVGLWLSWTFVARRLRRYTIAANDVLTIPEFFEVRFGDTTGILRGMTAAITILFVVFYVSSGLVGGSKLLDTMFGIETNTGILLTFGAVASYTLIGGFLAVSRTDVFQALLMITSLTIIAAVLISSTGSPFVDTTGETQGFFNPFTSSTGSSIDAVFILSALGWAFGAFGAQRILQRFMAIEREDHIPRSRNLSFVWLVLVYSLALVVGLVAHSALTESAMLGEVTDPERIYVVVSEVFFHPAVTGLLLTAVIAAVMSTADSQLLLASAVATDDMPVLKRIAYAISENRRVWLGRLLLVIIGGVGVLVSVYFPGSINELVAYAWGGMGAAFGPVTILALFWRRFNFPGALASIVVGTVVASIWAFSDGGPSGMWDMQPATPGFILASVVAVVVTLVTPPPSREVVDLFDRVNAR